MVELRSTKKKNELVRLKTAIFPQKSGHNILFLNATFYAENRCGILFYT
jgi:hypothetical protein